MVKLGRCVVANDLAWLHIENIGTDIIFHVSEVKPHYRIVNTASYSLTLLERTEAGLVVDSTYGGIITFR